MKWIYCRPNSSPQARILVATIVGILLGGCSRPVGSRPVENSTEAPPQPRSREFWFADYLGGSQVGWTHITVGQPKSSQDVVEIRWEGEMSIQRFGTTVSQSLSSVSTETSDGVLKSFESRSQTGTDVTVHRGSVQDGKLVITTESSGQKAQEVLDWKSGWGGFYAMEQSLIRSPMKPGEERKIVSIVPVLNKVGEQTLRAEQWEQTDVLGKPENLLKISVMLQLGPIRIDTITWADAEGLVAKSSVPSLGQTSYRTTRDVAQARRPANGFDLGEATLVRLKNPPRDLSSRDRVKYRIRVEGNSSIRTAFPSDAGQRVVVIDDQTADVEVRAVRSDDRGDVDPKPSPPTEADRTSNPRIQSDVPAVVRLASSVLPLSQDAGAIARGLESLVRSRMKSQSFAPALASAATVAETLQGDCTEYAVLLAALCRQRGIPARVAVGLVYSDRDQAFAFHMWNEVWVKDKWIGLDGTRGIGKTTAAYLKLADSNLQSGDEASILLPVFQVLGHLKIEIVE